MKPSIATIGISVILSLSVHLLWGKGSGLSDLPESAQRFYADHYNGQTVLRVTDNSKTEQYIIKLLDNSYLIFDADGAWVKVAGTFLNPVPASVIALLPLEAQLALVERFSGPVVAVKRLPDATYQVVLYVTSQTTVPVTVIFNASGEVMQHLW